ncbi:hypothetical protein [Methylobacterium sp. 285MFTsu5.1]|uniref:hypothetical protein n=1 Tax=Methylobacterium sp. 285MFTsu5.1 TaxID=1172187 RepID=UPI00131A049D|nr:hypothetical protein [Methylobacterium sp. 285MFTsu5.1]
MEKIKLRINPLDWLIAAPNGCSKARASEILATFSSPPHVYKFTGPGELLRGTGTDSTGKQAFAYGGGYWVDGSVISQIDANLSQYTGWLSAKELQQSARAKYRAGSAVCEDWNDFSQFHKMKIPTGETFEGLAGAIKSQPIRSKMNKNDPKTPMLMGGFEQVYLKVRNPFWIYEAAPL